MRDRADAFVEGGGSWAIFSGNTCFWQVRYEDDGRTMVCYKGQCPVGGSGRRHRRSRVDHDDVVASLDRPAGGVDDRSQLHPRRLCPRRARRRRGARVGTASTAPITRCSRGPTCATATSSGMPAKIVGYEVDGCELTMVNGDPVPTYNDGTPAGFEVLGTAPARLISITDNVVRGAAGAVGRRLEPPGDLEGVAAGLFGSASPENIARIAHGHAVMGTFTKGKGRVFNAGMHRLELRPRHRPVGAAGDPQRHPLAHSRRLRVAGESIRERALLGS